MKRAVLPGRTFILLDNTHLKKRDERRTPNFERPTLNTVCCRFIKILSLTNLSMETCLALENFGVFISDLQRDLHT